MVLFSPPNLSGGIDSALQTTAQAVPILPIMILVFVFIMILIGGASNQSRRRGQADMPFWAVLSATATTFLALIFTIGGGLIDSITLSIVVGVNVLMGVWFFLSKVRGEP